MYLIAIDLDGTLLRNDGKVSTYTKDTIQAISQEGHKVVIATGRHPFLTMPIVKELGLIDAVVCFNGAYIQTPDQLTPIQYTYGSHEIIALAEFLKERHYRYVIGTKSSYVIDSSFSNEKKKWERLSVPVQLAKSVLEIEDPIYKTSVLGAEKELDKVEEHIQAMVPELRVVRSGEDSIDIIHSSTSKGKAMEWLVNYYKWGEANTLAFGNYYNDTDMISFANIGVAMRNAPSPIKKYASYVTRSNEEDGVAFMLESFLLSQGEDRQSFLQRLRDEKSLPL